MATTLPGFTHGNGAVLARHVTGAPVVAESTTLTDANFAPGNAIVCTGWRSVLLFTRLTAGGATTANLQILVRAGLTPTTADSWTVSDPAAGTGAAVAGQYVIVDVWGRTIFPRIHAVTGAPTVVDVWVAGWEPLPREVARA